MEPKPCSQPWTPPDPTTIVIPGVDPTASINEQIDQIDQLITIRLQNIDANFSRIQQLIASKLLPAFRKYAEGTEPVREAAKFWKSFYEAAAQIRIPLASDISLDQSAETEVTNTPQDEEQDSEQQADEGDTTIQSYDTANTTPVANDTFMQGAPISSTPLVRDTRATGEDEAWSASIESPFERLHREVQSLAIEDELPTNSSILSLPEAPKNIFPVSTLPVLEEPKVPVTNPRPPSPPQSRNKGKSPLRENILRHNAKKTALSQGPSLHKTPRHQTPQHPFSNTHRWNGLVDLRQPSPSKQYKPGPSKHDYDSDSSDDLIPPGMSPPVTMQFAMPARLRTSPVKLSLTPARQAAEKIKGRYVVNAASRGIGLASPSRPALEPSISSVAPSLPSMSKYTYPSSSHITNSSSFNSRVSIPNHPSTSQQSDGIMTPAHQIYKSRVGPQPPQATTATGANDEPLINLSDDITMKPSSQDQVYVMPKSRLLIDDEASLSPDSDSDLSEHNEQNPSNGFLYATQNNVQTDDSFSDDGEDSFTNIGRPAGQLHPVIDMFAQFEGENVNVDDDSFDQDSFSANEEEETIFGGRQANEGADGRLNIRKVPLIDDAHTGVVSLNPYAQIEQSPTPYVGQGAPLMHK